MRMAPRDHPRLPYQAGMRRQRERSSPHARLLRCLLHLAGPAARVESASCRPWASATFQGSRHLVELRFGGAAAHAGATAMAERTPDADFSIPGHIVADVSIDGMELVRDDTSCPTALLRLSALTVEDW
jgi:hypothetical protein